MVLSLCALSLMLLLMVGVPVAFSLAIAGSTGLLAWGGSDLLVGILSTAPYSAVSSYEFLTIPMFLLMAQLMVASKISDSLFNAIATWTGRLPGGLGIATALSGAAFGAISGSSTASAATLSSAAIPAMVKAGYEPRFAYGIVSISGTLAMLIPPSVAIIFFGLLSGLSVAKLLIAGILPAALVVLTIVLTIWLLLWLDPKRGGERRSYTWREKFRSLPVAGPFIFLFSIVTGLIYLGIATPVESSAIGAFGALLLTIYTRKFSWPMFANALLRACATSAMLALIVTCAQIFGYFLTVTEATQHLIAYVHSLGLSPYMVLAFLVVMYLVLGCFLDQLSILVLTVPVVIPLVIDLGFNPIWFGILKIVLAEIGMVVPPIGLNVFVVAKTANVPIKEVFHGIWPHVIAHLVFIVLLIAFPQIALWLPSRMQ